MAGFEKPGFGLVEPVLKILRYILWDVSLSLGLFQNFILYTSYPLRLIADFLGVTNQEVFKTN